MNQSIPAARVAALVAGFDRWPAYAGLADALVLLIGDGRLPVAARLPSERELTTALGVSRTTVARAYAVLRESGFATARHGSGTFTAVPGGRARVRDRLITPWADGAGMIDLNCAAGSAPPEITSAYAGAAAALPAYLGSHGYFPAGLPELQAAIARSYEERGLPTEPAQIIVTPGALAAAAVVARAVCGRGDRVVVESPVYPNAVQALRDAGARLVEAPVDPEGWDVPALTAAIGGAGAAAAYLIPDFQNPTGQLMDDEQRSRLAAALADSGTVPIVDEAHYALALDGQPLPRPFAAHARGTVSIGSASKAFWGGLRIGWIRAPHRLVDTITRARLALDLGVPVMEQLALVALLGGGPVSAFQLARLGEQRAALATALGQHLPAWRFLLPGGGLSLWCRVSGSASRLARVAQEYGVVVAPGPVFAVNGGLDGFVRLPWTRPEAELVEAVRRLRAAQEASLGGAAGHGRADRPALVV